MNIINKDILKAKTLIEDNKRFIPKHHKFERIYPFTNENFKDALNKINLINKNSLTVLGSGDQTLDILLKGSDKITTFDINPLTKYYFYLKKAALQANLTLYEYLNFFCYRDYPGENLINKNTFNLNTFDKLVPYLKKDDYDFWTSLFDEYTPKEIRAYNGLFNFDELKYNVLSQTINYLTDEKQFSLLKEKIPDLKLAFINQNIVDLPNVLNKNYDFIYLSNIIQYIDEIYNNPSKDKELQLINVKKFYQLIKELCNYLKDNGKLIAGYIYNYEIENNDNSIFNKDIRDEIFCDKEFNYHIFKGVNTYKKKLYFNGLFGNEDACMVYSKK